jgi:hypothetical protein
MAQIVRYCADCGWDRPFEQIYDLPGECPDCPEGDCAEFACTDCGSALLIGVAWFSSRPAAAAEPRGRVA